MRTFMEQSIEIMAGQYQSNRLSIEIARLSDQLSSIKSNSETKQVLKECRAFLYEPLKIYGKSKSDIENDICIIDNGRDLNERVYK